MATPIPHNYASFSLDEVLLATGGRLARKGQQQAHGVATDTRESLKDKIFVALRGERYDAHEYLSHAVEAGAVLLVAQEVRPDQLLLDVSLVLVPDTLRALGQLALFHRNRWGKSVVVIGGSAGKTTTRSVTSRLLETVLPTRVAATVGNLNNRVGVPMTLLGLEEKHEVAVLELGTNQHGEMQELSLMARPQAALLTLIDWEHSQGLGDLDGIEREEGALFAGLDEFGVALGYGEDPRVKRQVNQAKAHKKLFYGFEGEEFAALRQRTAIAPNKVELRVALAGRELCIETGLLGRPGSLAVLAGLSICEALYPGKIEERAASFALADAGEPGRSQLIALTNGAWILDDSYNSNPVSVRNSIHTGQELTGQTGGKLYLALGEMLELGAFSEAAHEEMGVLAAKSGAAFLVGIQGDTRLTVDHAGALGLDSQFVERSAEASDLFAERLRLGDVLVVKASRGVRAERLVNDLVERIGRKAPVPATSLHSSERAFAAPPTGARR